MASRSNNSLALRTKLGEFLAIRQENLIERTQWGDITFSDAKDDVDAIYNVIHILNGLPLESLPSSAMNDVLNALNDTLGWITRIDKFSLRDGSPTQNQQEIVGNLHGVQEQLYIRTHQWIPFLAYMKGDIPAQLDAITNSVKVAEVTSGDFQKFSDERRKEIDAAVAAAREASAKAGAAHFTKDFLDDAAARDADAQKWLWWALGSAAVTIFAAVAFFFLSAPSDLYAVVQYTTSKIVILAMLLATTAWCAGNFRANKHQATVSRHKGHSLQTFQAFVQASDNPDIKDAVLLETTRAVFAHAQSGYLKGESTMEGGARVLEILRASGSPKISE